MRDIDPSMLALAMKGMQNTEAEVQEKILKNMSKRAATLLQEDMDFMGPVRLKDAQGAREAIVDFILKLEECGKIIIARAGKEDMIV